ncbi:MAG: hypothetical protein K0S41_263 [Anaerocolumna sp.]|jgi:hypothetical protein|nr:hypothetical protein [Anaerocolumna sp.]
MFIKGYTYGYGAKKGAYRTQKAMESVDRLCETGTEWMCLAFNIQQKTYSSTEILFDYRRTITDKDVIFAINRAHEKGLKVCLKPMINCDDGMWRALINFPDEDMMGNDKYWKAWFESYSAFLCHYAEIAEDYNCEMFCLGCEMLGTERKETFWRSLIKEVKEIYHGPLVYNTNHGKEENVKWFDELDYIGTSAYYPVAEYPGDSLENMTNKWRQIAKKLKAVSEKFGKPILFMEIGCRSAKGCAMMPWDFTHRDFPMDEEEQANFYDSCLTALHDEPWFAGVFWWDWSIEIYDSKEVASKDLGFNIHMKKAEDVIKKWYKEIIK